MGDEAVLFSFRQVLADAARSLGLHRTILYSTFSDARLVELGWGWFVPPAR
jgi:hypothetical protein